MMDLGFKIVNNSDFMSIPHQSVHQKTANKTCASCNKYVHIFLKHRTILVEKFCKNKGRLTKAVSNIRIFFIEINISFPFVMRLLKQKQVKSIVTNLSPEIKRLCIVYRIRTLQNLSVVPRIYFPPRIT